jgi:DNA-binding beta-propeller fold protein YncE
MVTNDKPKKLIPILILGMCIAPIAVLSNHAFSQQMGLQLEATFALGDVRGRIDHMAADPDRHRLFVAELGNDTVGIVDLEQRKTLKVIPGLKEPQGVGYLRSTDTLYVANGGDGSLRLYQGPDYAGNGRIDLGSDADNVRVDQAHQQIVVGYGSGALAIIDAVARSKVAEIPLRAHPEGFQLDAGTHRAYVNVPNARSIAVADLLSRKQVASWSTGGAAANFPMTLDGQSKRVLVMFRDPAKLGVFDTQDGSIAASVEACGDADDLFIDSKRQRIYVSCGAGAVDVLNAQSYQRIARIPTVAGARTSLFVPELDRFFLAARAASGNPAAIWIFRPMP